MRGREDLHDVGELGEASDVEAEVGRDDGGEGDLEGLNTTVNVAGDDGLVLGGDLDLEEMSEEGKGTWG